MTNSMRIGIVTCAIEKFRDYFPTRAEPDFVPSEPLITPDDQLLVDELRRRGHRVAPLVWGGDTSVLRDSFDRVIVRSPWDYMDSDALRNAFVAWLDALGQSGVPVDNDPALMLWLMHKRYLLDFAAAGVPIVPTTIVPTTIVPTTVVPQGETHDLATAAERCCGVVVKPAVSAAGAGLKFLPDRESAQAFQAAFDASCQLADQLVQPFLPEIRSRGEWSLVYLAGRYSHAVHKLPRDGSILVHAEQGGSLRFAEPPQTVKCAGDQVAAACSPAFARHGGQLDEPPLYLRIDIIETAAGALLSECEGVEPELFFRARPDSERDCATAIEARAAHSR